VIISDVQYWQVRVPMKPDTVNSPEWGPAAALEHYRVR
jgi:hypothetical protein